MTTYIENCDEKMLSRLWNEDFLKFTQGEFKAVGMIQDPRFEAK